MPARRPDSVLFLQSGTHFAADAQVHAAVMRHLPALGFGVHAACSPGTAASPSPARAVIAAIPGVRVYAATYGPAMTSRRPLALLRDVATSVPRTVWTLGSLVRLVRRERIAVVHCTEKAREAFFGYVVARLGGASLAIHLHVKVEGWFNPITRWVMRRADLLIAISQFVRQSAIDMGYQPERIVVVPNGLSPRAEPSPGMASERQAVVAELGLGDGRVIVCTAARINRWKGQRELIEALAAAAADFPDFELLVVGSDHDAGDSGKGLTHDLRLRADELGVGDRVHFLGFREDVPRLMGACDIYAMPSHEEPFGLVFIEAMAAGKAVIGVDNGGTPEVVVDGTTGLLSKNGDHESLVANLLTLLRDADLRNRMGAAGRERVAAQFTTEQMAEATAAAYRGVADRR